MREVEHVPQIRGERWRRWFAGGGLDLIAWSDPDGSIASFQLCFADPSDAEWAVVWRREESDLRHFSVDTGEGRPMSYKATPVLRPAPATDLVAVAERFEREAAGLDPGLRGLVLDVLRSGGPGSRG